MEELENFPPIKWSLVHPRLAAWIVLSVGMIALLVYEARDVGLKAGNWIALILATILVAGACILIISWEDEEGEIDEKAKREDETVALAVARLLQDRSSQDKCKEVARGHGYEVFGIRRFIDQHIRLYENLLSGVSPGEGITDSAVVT